MEDQNNCPKPDCGRPESTDRWKAGKRLSICGNGHSWDAKEVAEQRAKAKEAVDTEAATKRLEQLTVRAGGVIPARPFVPNDPYLK